MGTLRSRPQHLTGLALYRWNGAKGIGIDVDNDDIYCGDVKQCIINLVMLTGGNVDKMVFVTERDIGAFARGSRSLSTWSGSLVDHLLRLFDWC